MSRRPVTVEQETELIVDSFAGGGGASLGIEMALGRSVDIAINHDSDAIAVHAANHPRTRHVLEDVWHTKLRDLIGERSVGLLWASPDCRHFSRAKGSAPVSKRVRSLAWVVVRWASQVRPRVICLENVREFADWGPISPQLRCECGWLGTAGQAQLQRAGRACPRCQSTDLEETGASVPEPARKGVTFRLFVNRLRGFGYRVEWRNLNAADYGAPTQRRRLFLVARCDGRPIVWPEPTHGDPSKIDDQPLFSRLKPWRTAAECIDWSEPVRSIFDRPKPLAEKTLARIAAGMKRYVLDDPNPFLVCLTHDGQRRSPSLAEPMPTITSANRGELALVVPSIVDCAYGDSGRRGKGAYPIKQPLGVVHSGGKNHALVAAHLATIGYSEREGQEPRSGSVDRPLGTVVGSGAKAAIVETSLEAVAFVSEQWGRSVGSKAEKPLCTTTTNSKAALVTAFIAKHFGGMVGDRADAPLGTTTKSGSQNQLVAASLARFNHGEKQWSSVEEPLGVVTSQGNKFGLVYAFLSKYFATAIGAACSEPLPTATSKARFAVVKVVVESGEATDAVAVDIAGVGPCVITDIGMRMLTPRELARAQGFPDSYRLTGTKTSQIARIGNSVCPQVAAAIVRANVER